MNVKLLTSLVRELDVAIRLAEDAEAMVPKPKERRKALAELACLAKRLKRIRREVVESLLTEVLWQYVGFNRGGETEATARRLLVEMGTSEKDS